MAIAGKDNFDNTSLWSAGGADWKFACPAVMPEAGTITSVWAYLCNYQTNHAACYVRAIVYNEGGTGSLLGYSNPVAFADNADDAWYEFSLTSPLAVSAGTYWVGNQFDANGNGVGVWGTTTGYGQTVWVADTYSDGPAATFGAGYSGDTSAQCFYVVYTPSGSNRSVLIGSGIGIA